MKLNTTKLNRFPKRIAVSAAALLALTALSAVAADYPTTVQSYHPVGYWQLNETTPVPVGDIATNLGSVGWLGHGDYVESVVHPVTSGILGDGGSTAMHLTNRNNQLTGFSKLRIPWQPQWNTNAPFSVEFWARPDYTDQPACAASSYDRVYSPISGWLFYQGGTSISDGNGWYFRVYNTSGGAINAAVDLSLDTTQWYHVVGVFTGTSIILYTNGVQAAVTAMTGTFAPVAPVSAGAPLCFGGRADGRSGNYGFGGDMAEGAIYNTALSASRVAAHYTAGITAGNGYAAAVMADSPVGWWRMNEPAYTEPDPGTLPVAANSGTIGANAQGIMYPGVVAGEAGPPCNGLGANNYSCLLDGGMGLINCGSDAGLNVPNKCTLTSWVKIRGWQHMSEAVFSKGQNGYSLSKNFTQSVPTYNQMAFNAGNGALTVGSRTVFDGLWHHVAGVYDGASMSLYIDGTLDSTAAYTGGINASDEPLTIGDEWINGAPYWIAAGGSGAGYMRVLYDGWIAHVAVLTNSLTAGQVLDLFNSAQERPVMTLQPQPPTGNVYEGMTVSFTASALGAATLNYVWTKNGTAFGPTGTSLTLANMTTGNSGTYAVVVNNSYGSVTSSVVALTVQTSPPLIFQQPKSITRFADGTATFTVVMGGSTPLSYQWTNSGGTIAGATKSSYTISHVRASDAGPYGVHISNIYGQADSTPANLTVLPTAPYSAVVMAGQPLIYWRLNATNNNTAGDYANGYDGTNDGTMTLSAGLAAPTFPGFEVGNQAYTFNGALTFMRGPALDLNRSAMSVSAWIVASNLSAGYYNGIVTKGDSSWRLHQQFQSPGVQWGLDGTTAAADNAAIASDDGQWHHVVGVYDGKASQLYVDGTLVSSAAGTGLIATNQYWIEVGENAEQTGRYWNGKISEVSLYNSPLSSIDVSNLFLTATLGPTMPIIVQQPVSQSVFVGETASFSADIYGGGPWTYTWKKNGVDMTGETNRTFDVRNAYYADAGNYTVGITNAAGGILSDPATLTVMPLPLFANLTNSLVAHLKFDGDYADSSGRGNGGTPQNTPTLITPGKIGSGALHYSTDINSSSYNCVSLSDPADLQFGPGQDFSVAFWTRFTGLPGNLPFLANSANSFGDPGVTLAPSSQQGGWSWYINDASAVTGQGIGVLDPIGATLNNGQWHSLVYTFSRSGFGTVYLDGAAASQTSIAAAQGWNLDTGSPWNIGQASGYYAVDGQFDMDDLGIWRRALSQAEAESIYIVGQNYGRSFDTYGPVTITPKLTSSGLELVWQAGTLLSADNPTGQWTPVSGASAPYCKLPTTAGRKFYRVQL
jgi:hypothetical protein